MKRKVRLSETDIRNLVLESVRNILNEDFANDELTKMVSEHGGLSTTTRFPGSWDARRHNHADNIANMKPKGYIDPDKIDILSMFSWFEPIGEQILFCQDGGAIVVEGDSSYDRGYNYYNNPNKNKMHDRLNNYLDDKGEEKYGRVGVDKYKNMDRRGEHFARRGVKTTGPNAGKRVKKKK